MGLEINVRTVRFAKYTPRLRPFLMLSVHPLFETIVSFLGSRFLESRIIFNLFKHNPNFDNHAFQERCFEWWYSKFYLGCNFLAISRRCNC